MASFILTTFSLPLQLSPIILPVCGSRRVAMSVCTLYFSHIGRSRNSGDAEQTTAEERIYSLFVLLPELFDHLFRVHKAQKAEESALHLVAAYLQKEAGEADELIGKNDYQPRVPDKAEEIEHALRVNGENGLVKIIEVEFHFTTP